MHFQSWWKESRCRRHAAFVLGVHVGRSNRFDKHLVLPEIKVVQINASGRNIASSFFCKRILDNHEGIVENGALVGLVERVEQGCR